MMSDARLEVKYKYSPILIEAAYKALQSRLRAEDLARAHARAVRRLVLMAGRDAIAGRQCLVKLGMIGADSDRRRVGIAEILDPTAKARQGVL